MTARNMIQKKQQTKKLIVQDGLSQKDAAAAVGVTEKTIGSWVKQYGWVAAAEMALADKRPANSLHDFMVYVRYSHPRRYNGVKELFESYMNTL